MVDNRICAWLLPSNQAGVSHHWACTHSCIGQQLARTVIAEAITQLLDRLPTLRLVEAEQLEPMPFAGDLPTYSPGRVHVTWA